MNKRYFLLLALTAFYFTKTSTLWCANQSDFIFTREIPIGIKSMPGNESTTVRQTIRNATSRFLDFRWINYDGNLNLVTPKTDWGHASIAPNNILQGLTSVGHPIAVIDSINGKLLGCYIFNNAGEYHLVIQESFFGFEIVLDNIR